jgi:hypothetical protein
VFPELTTEKQIVLFSGSVGHLESELEIMEAHYSLTCLRARQPLNQSQHGDTRPLYLVKLFHKADKLS